MLDKIKVHFKKHKKSYEFLLKTILYIVYYLAAVAFAYYIGLDLRYVVFWFMLMWTYPFEYLFDRFMKFNNQNREVKEDET